MSGTVGPAYAAATSERASGHCPERVVGYLWSDGHALPDGRWRYRTRSAVLAAEFSSCVKAVGAVAHEFRRGSVRLFTVRGLPMPVDLSGTPRAVAGASAAGVKTFLAAVIEGEGGRDGLVLDDSMRSRVEAMAALLARVGVATRVTGARFFRLYADRADWPVIHTFPFVVWDRVPGGRGT